GMLVWLMWRAECICVLFFFSSRRRHTRLVSDWSSDVCSSDLARSGRAGHRRHSGGQARRGRRRRGPGERGRPRPARRAPPGRGPEPKRGGEGERGGVGGGGGS